MSVCGCELATVQFITCVCHTCITTFFHIDVIGYYQLKFSEICTPKNEILGTPPRQWNSVITLKFSPFKNEFADLTNNWSVWTFELCTTPLLISLTCLLCSATLSNVCSEIWNLNVDFCAMYTPSFWSHGPVFRRQVTRLRLFWERFSCTPMLFAVTSEATICPHEKHTHWLRFQANPR